MSPVKHVVISAIALMVCMLVFEFTDLDIWVQNILFDASNNTWLLNKSNDTLHFWLYYLPKKVIMFFSLGILLSLVFLRKQPWVKNYQRGLIVVLLSVLIIPSVVGALKATTNVACPKHLVNYGGEIPYIGVFEAYPQSLSLTGTYRCFPAGHASGGFALMALYFLAKSRRRRTQLLSFGIFLGWLTGGYKMLIGDHFLSHTLVTMILAWLLINVNVLASSVFDALSMRFLTLKAGPVKATIESAKNVHEV